jgi:hypothetical protein
MRALIFWSECAPLAFPNALQASEHGSALAIGEYAADDHVAGRMQFERLVSWISSLAMGMAVVVA